MIHEPKDLSKEQKAKIIEVELYKRNGGSVSCAHDFHDAVRDGEYGDIFLCGRCCQYFVKARALVWWIEGDPETGKPPRSNHLGRGHHHQHRDDVWLHPVGMRLQDKHGNTKHTKR